MLFLEDYTPQKTAGILISFSKQVFDTRKSILDEILKEKKREEKRLNRVARQAAAAQKKTGVGNVKQFYNNSEDTTDSGSIELEEFLDQVATKNLSNKKRRRSQQKCSESFDLAAAFIEKL